ncbi:MAG TPA: TetR family transcriptional regulator [Patescibacteria group bacterium]|nr:TetR family transcriptional regulator [Patescibacteria group bacterium]
MKEKYLEVATRLFAKKGFSNVSLRELAGAARANSALISYYFGNKEGLYGAVIEAQFAPILELLQRFENAKASPTEKLQAYAQGVMTIHQRHPFVLQFLHSELANPTPFLNSVIVDRVRHAQKFLYATICEGIACGQFRNDIDPHFAVIAMVGMLNFYFLARPITQNFLPDHATEDSDFIQQAMKIFLQGIRRDDRE